MSNPVATAEVSGPVDFVDLVPLSPVSPAWWEIAYLGVNDDRSVSPAPDSLLTMYLGFGSPIVYHEGATFPHYNTTGLSNFQAEPNDDWTARRKSDGERLRVPIGLGDPQRLHLGFRLGADGGSKLSLGTSGRASVFSPGLVSGHNKVQSYTAKSWTGLIGGVAGQSRPEGGSYFPGDPAGTPFDWPIQTDWVGHYDGNLGQIPTGFRFRVNGALQEGFKIISGRFELYAFGAGVPGSEEPPPPPPLTWSQIGDFNSAQCFNGVTDLGAADCSFAVNATNPWVGKAWSEPQTIEAATVYASNNDGFVFGPHDDVTVKVFGSNSAPSHSQDGTLLGQQTVMDGLGKVVSFSGLPATPYAFHWVEISHSNSPTSMYVAEVVF